MRSLPPVVFQHFRDPKNLRVLDPADAVGQVEGRREESWIRLYLRNEPTGVLTSFQLHGDRSCTAGLSLLTCHVNGRPLAEVEALTVEDVANAYGLTETLHPTLIPAVEVLQATLADLRGEPCPFDAEGEVVCQCLYVRRGRIERTIRERKLKTVQEVRFWTRACTGCRSCRPDVEAMLARLAEDQG